MPQVLFQIGNPFGEASVVNDPSYITPTVLEYLERNPKRPVVINRAELSDEEFTALLAICQKMADAGDAEMTVRVVPSEEQS